MTEETQAMVSMLDIFVISGAVGFCAYWFFIRAKKQPEFTEIKRLAPMTVTRSQSYDPSFIGKMNKTGRNVIIFYGSQTGTAEEFAGRLAKDCNRYGMKGMAADPEEFDMDDLVKLKDIENGLVIFCMATYGEGDPTDNAHELHEWLQNEQDLEGVNYAVFALGNKTYEHYNAMGIYADERLEKLGATRVFEIGLGDDDANIEDDFVSWRERFWPAVCEKFGIEATGEDITMRQYTLTVHDETLPKEKIFKGEPARLNSYNTQKPPFDAKNPFMAPVIVNKELHQGGDRSCMHVEFDITGSKIRYEAGDHVAVYPTNNPELVESIGKRLNIDLETVFSLDNVDEEASKKHPFPNPCSYRTALTHYLDITSRPRTHILKELADYCSDPAEKERLLLMASSSDEGKAAYHSFIIDDNRHIFAILEGLPSLMPDIDHICELLPKLQARYYSISSSPKVNPTSIHITAVVVDYQTRIGVQMNGVATSYLSIKLPTESLKPTVPIYVRKSQFRLPFRSTTPVIMVGPGTGLAPFRGFIQSRDSERQAGKKIGEMSLYFGCRHKEQDFIYRDEIEKYEADGTLSKVHLAFSRDQQEKIYVQHLMQQNQDEIWRILEDGGHIYVCGDARNMARDVHKCLVDVITEKGDKSSNEAEDYIKKLQQKGRFAQDVWS